MRSLWLVGCLLLVWGCGDEVAPSSSAPSSSAPSHAAPSVPVTAEPPPAVVSTPERPAGIDESAVRALVDGWIAAQNSGDFAAYGASYASRFEGIKRSGPRTYKFDRTTWLADRQRMFARPMEVAIEGLAIDVTGPIAVARFRQTWASETYRDTGPKQLVVVEDSGRVRIAREEMRESTVDGSAASSAPARELFMLVVSAGAPYVVLHPSPEDAWSTGAVRLLARSSPMAVARDTAAGALPAELAAWNGRAVRLYGPAGEVCSGSLGSLAVVRRVTPHFGVGQVWNGEMGDPPATEQQIADDTWGIAGEQGAVLAAAVHTETGSCEDALWARAADAPAPAVYASEPAHAQATAAAIRALRALPAHASIQQSYAADPTSLPRATWHEHGGASPTVTRFVHAGSGRSIVTVHARAGAGCADFFGELWGAFEPAGNALRPIVTRTDPGAFVPLAAVDADGDGTVEVIVPDGLVRTGRTGHTVLLDARPPYLDCGC